MTKSALVVLGAAACAVVAAVFACSSTGAPGEPLATTTELLTTGTNAHVMDLDHETSATYVSPASDQHWVLGFNNFANGNSACNWANWAYSNASGSLWTAFEQDSGLQFGNPGTSPSTGTAFSGWAGDPAVAAVTDPTINNGGKRVLYTNVGKTAASDGAACQQFSDVVIALSDDGGHSWGNAAYVNTASTGGNVDNPSMASDPISPYKTWVVWQNGTTGWLSSVQYSTGTPPVLTASTPVQVPNTISGTTYPVYHPRVAIGRIKGCGTNREGVWVAWATGGERCNPGVNCTRATTSISWLAAVYDGSVWLGPVVLDTDSSWPNCIGGGTTACDGGSPPSSLDNDVRPAITADPVPQHNSMGVDITAGWFWVAHTHSTTNGTRIWYDYGQVYCNFTSKISVSSGQASPNPCDKNVGGGCQFGDGGANNGPDGGTIVQDDFGPSLSFNYNGSTPRTLLTYYTARDDINNINVDLYAIDSEGEGVNGNNWGNLTQLSVAASGQTIPWDYHTCGIPQTGSNNWIDYQTSAAWAPPDGGSFLGAWGGDGRDASACGIWSAVVQ